MTATTKTAPKQKSQKALSKAEAEEALKIYKKAKAKKKEANDEMKAAEENLHQYAEEHPEEFGDSKTLVMENGKLKWTPEGTVETPEDFDPVKFMDEFPNCVKYSLSVGKVKEALNNNVSAKKIKKYNLDISYEDKFKVEV